MLVRRIGVLCATVLMLCVLLGCGAPKEPGRYYNRGEGFSIKFPEGWEEEANVPVGIDVLVSNPEGEEFLTAISVAAQKLLPNITFEQYLELVSSRAGHKIDSGQTTIDGVDAYWLDSTKHQGGKESRILQYSMMKGKRVYTILFVETPDRFPDYEDEFVKVAKSFRFE